MRKQFSQDYYPVGIYESTEVPRVMFPQSIPHQLSETVVPVFSSTYRPLVRKTEETIGGRSSYQPVNLPALGNYDLSAIDLLSPDQQEYLQDLFYVTRGTIPFHASESLRRDGGQTHGLVCFYDDLSFTLTPTDFATDFEGNSEERNLTGSIISLDRVDTYQARAGAINIGHISPFEEAEQIRSSANEFGSLFTKPESFTETFYTSEEGILKKRLLISYNDEEGVVLVEVDSDLPANQGRERVLTGDGDWPVAVTGEARFSYLASSGQWAFYTAAAYSNQTGRGILFDLVSGSSFLLQFALEGQVSPHSLIPFDLAGRAGFLVALSNREGTAGSVEWVDPLLRSTIVIEGWAGEVPTALLSHNGQDVIIATKSGEATINIYEYSTAQGLGGRGQDRNITLVSSFVAPSLPGENWAAAELFTHKQSAHAVLRRTESLVTFRPSVINLLEQTIVESQEEYTASNDLFFNTHATIVSGPDAYYVFLKDSPYYEEENLDQPSALLLSSAATIQADYIDPFSPAPSIPGLYRYYTLSADQYLFRQVGNMERESASLSPLDIGLFHGTVLFSNISASPEGAVSVLMPSYSHHKAIPIVRAVRINTGKPFPVATRFLDTDVPAGQVNTLWSNSAEGRFLVSSLPNTVSQSVVDFVVRSDKVYGVELLAASVSPTIRSRLVEYEDLLGTAPVGTSLLPQLTLPSAPIDTTVYFDEVAEKELLAWDSSLLSIDPRFLQAKVDHEFEFFWPPTLDYTQRFTTLDVGFVLKTSVFNFTDFEFPLFAPVVHELFVPSVGMSAIELSGELNPSNTAVDGHRFFNSSPGDYATHAIGSTLGVTAYQANILAEVDVIHVGAQVSADFVVSTF
jgi:hypothetical protein